MNFIKILIPIVIIAIVLILYFRPDIIGLKSSLSDTIQQSTDSFMKSVPTGQEFVQFSTPLLQTVNK